MVPTLESHSLLRSACLQARATCLLQPADDVAAMQATGRFHLHGVPLACRLAPASSAAGWS